MRKADIDDHFSLKSLLSVLSKNQKPFKHELSPDNTTILSDINPQLLFPNFNRFLYINPRLLNINHRYEKRHRPLDVCHLYRNHQHQITIYVIMEDHSSNDKNGAVSDDDSSHFKLDQDAVKPFKCQQCSSAFTSKGELKTHEHIHLGLKPFKCPQCPSAFT